ncbi:hypothetical protein [Zavarzinia sp. CC-PAN008]|uniref:hypothetical protein n=1 Tax=Zavarzinia sp. CC-PAN008 TaxID=3243332 RepID=UPI003F74A100
MSGLRLDEDQRGALVAALEAVEAAATPEDAALAGLALVRLRAELSLSWDDLIVDGDAAQGWAGAAASDMTPVDPQGPVEACLDALLAKPGLSADTRDELGAYLAAARSGTLEAEDAAYVRALYRRLMG